MTTKKKRTARVERVYVENTNPSPYFKDAISGEVREGQKLRVRLRENAPVAVGRVIA